VTPYRYCVKHRLVEGLWWWCPGYYDDKKQFWTVGYRATRRAALVDADNHNRRVRQLEWL